MGGKVHSLSPLDTRQQTTYTTVLDSTYYEKLVEAAATKVPWQPNELNILWNKHMCPEFFFPLWIITFENVGHHHWLCLFNFHSSKKSQIKSKPIAETLGLHFWPKRPEKEVQKQVLANNNLFLGRKMHYSSKQLFIQRCWLQKPFGWV